MDEKIKFAEKKSPGSKGLKSRQHNKDIEKLIQTREAQVCLVEKDSQTLSAIFNNTEVGFLIIGPDLKIKWKNIIVKEWMEEEGLGNINGMDYKKLLNSFGKTLPEPGPIEQVFKTSRVANYKFRMGSDINLTNISMTAMPILTPDGKVHEVLVMLRDLTDFETLRKSQKKLEQSEKLTKILFKISNAVNTTLSLDDLFQSIYKALANIIDVTNFAIGIYNKHKDTISYPFYVDETNDIYHEIPDVSTSGIFAAEVINQKKPLFLSKKDVILRKKKAGRKSIDSSPEQWLGIPLKIKKEVIGVIVVQSYSNPELYSKKDADILMAISDQIATAITKKQSEDAQKKSEEINKVLFAISNAVNTTSDLNELYKSIHKSLGKIIDLKNFIIGLHNIKNDTILFEYYVDQFDDSQGESMKIGEGSVGGEVIRSGKAVFLTKDKLIKKNKKIKAVGTWAKTWMGVPLKADNKVIGYMATQSYTDPDLYSKKDLAIFSSVSDQVALAIARKRAQDAEIKNKAINKALFSISNAVNTTDNLKDLYKSIHKSLEHIIDVTNFFIAINDREKDILSFPYDVDTVDEAGYEIHSASKSSSLTSEVILKGKPLFFTKQEMIDRAVRMNLEVTGTPAAQWLGVPLKTKDDIIGAIVIQSYDDPNIYDTKDMDLLIAVSDQVALAIERKRTEDAQKKSEKLNKVLFAISNAVNTTENLDELYKSIYNSLNQLKTLPNFFICIVEKEKQQLYFPLYIDEYDSYNPAIPDKYDENNQSITIEIIKSKKYKFLNEAQLRKRHVSNKLSGTKSKVWLGVPLLIRGKVTGVIAVQHYSDPNYFTRDDVSLFTAVSDQIAIAIDRKRSLEELKNSELLTKTIFQISNAVNTTDNLDALFKSIHKSLNRIIDATNFYIALYDNQKDIISFPYHVDLFDDDTGFSDNINSRKSSSLTNLVIQKNKPLFFKKHEMISRAKSMNLELSGSLSELWLGVPLKTKGEVIGAIVIQSYDDPDVYDQKDMDLLIAVSDQVALAIERKRAQDAQKKSEELNKVLFAISNAVNTTGNLEGLCNSIHNSLQKVIYVENFSLSLYDKNTDQLDRVYSCDITLPTGILKNASKSNSMAFEVIRRGTPLLMDAQEQQKLAQKFGGTMIGALSKSWLCVPLKIKDETIGAVLTQDYTTENCYKRKDIELLTLVSGQIALAIDRKRSQEIIIAHKDTLEKTVEKRTNKLTSEIKERIQIEKRLKKAKIAAEAAAKSKSEFLANMSHEIRTPINGIMGMAEIALGNNLNNELHPLIKTIDTEANSLLGIVNQILDFSKIEAGKLLLEQIPFNLRNTFEQACSSLAISVNDEKVEFISFLTPDVPVELMGDPGRLRQILINLTSNAIKFTHTGEILVKCEKVRDYKSSVELRFLIQDTGIGIAANKQQEIFKGFSQADGSTTREYGGTGLGTTISKQLVELMNGQIGLESELCKGSTFWFTVKFKKQKETKKKNFKKEIDYKGLRVLFADGNKTNRYVFLEYLKSFGATPISADNEKEVFKILKNGLINSKPIDVIITALGTSSVDSFELSKKIRVKEEFHDLPIIIVTSSGNIGDGIICKDIGIESYLFKPVKQTELKAAIDKVLNRSAFETKENSKLITRHTIAEERINNVRLLLVEDYLTNQKVAMKHLSQEGYNITLAENGKIAVDLFKQKYFDLILMDIQMPVMDGYEATHLIRDYEAKLSNVKVNDSVDNTPCRIPIIAMTAHALEGYKKKCLKADMDDFITKPIRRENFLLTIKKWLPQPGVAKSDTKPMDEQKGEQKIDQKPISSTKAKDRTKGIPLEYEKVLYEFDNDKKFLNDIIDEFLKTVEKQLVKIEQAISSKNYETFEKEAHSIKGGAANLTANNLSAAAHDLEKIGAAKTHSNSLAAFEILKDEFYQLKKDAAKFY